MATAGKAKRCEQRVDDGVLGLRGICPHRAGATDPARSLDGNAHLWLVARETVETTVTNPSAIKPAKITNTMVVVRKTTNAACIHLREGARKVETGSLKA
jgi:hypothetical protein